MDAKPQPEELRTAALRIPLTEAERDRIEQAAGGTIVTWARLVLLNAANLDASQKKTSDRASNA